MTIISGPIAPAERERNPGDLILGKRLVSWVMVMFLEAMEANYRFVEL